MDDLVSEFITETSESLSMLDMELVKLEQNPDDPELLGNIFRIVHTIKGTCGFLGLPRLEKVAHAGENVLGKVRDHEIEVSTHAVSLILECLDTIKTIMDHLESEGVEPEGNDQDLIDRLNKCAFGEEGAAPTGDEMEAAFAAAEGPSDSKETGDETETAATEPEEEAVDAGQAPEVQEAATVDNSTEPEKAPEAGPVPAASKSTPEKAPAAAKAASGGIANQSIRVNLEVLEGLMQMVSELVLARNQLLQMVRGHTDSEFTAPLQRLSHITSELQEGVMQTRMQPIGNAWAKFPRLVRDLSLELNKKVELRMVGAETELDRQLLEMIKDPLTHMVRNSCDHGLETPEKRKENGKPETGTITLKAYHEGGHIIIDIEDDGQGISAEKLKTKIIEKNLATESELEGLTDQQVMQYIFRPGFSTAEKVTSVSGRGVGMDVVRTNIEKIGGTIELNSRFGKGSVFSIKIPLTLAIVSVLIVESSGNRFAIPQINITEMVRITAQSEYTIEEVSGTQVLRLRERLLPLLNLSENLSMEKSECNGSRFIVVCKVGGFEYGVVVDRVFDTEEIVVKPVAPILQHIAVYAGCTILGDGSVILILDPNGLAKTLGDIDLSGESSSQQEEASFASSELTSFLVFKAGSGAPKAVPLELVSRLEEVDISRVERSGDYQVVQYRDTLMRLVTLDSSYSLKESGLQEVIVFSMDNNILGLVSEEILDIVEETLDVKMSTEVPGFLGSMVIHGTTTDVVDAGHFITRHMGDLNAFDAASAKVERKRVLLVDDSAFFRNLTAPYLSVSGYEVKTADSAVSALELLENSTTSFDVIISDIEMPEMNGFEFAETCRNRSELASIPIIAVSARVTEEMQERGQVAGFDALLEKTDRDGLMSTIKQYLKASEEVEQAA